MGYEYILMDEAFRCLRGKAEVVEGEFEGSKTSMKTFIKADLDGTTFAYDYCS